MENEEDIPIDDIEDRENVEDKTLQKKIQTLVRLIHQLKLRLMIISKYIYKGIFNIAKI